MKHVDCIVKLRDIDYTPLTQYMNTNFFCAIPDGRYWLPIARIQSILNRTEFKSCGPAGFIREIPEIVQA